MPLSQSQIRKIATNEAYRKRNFEAVTVEDKHGIWLTGWKFKRGKRRGKTAHVLPTSIMLEPKKKVGEIQIKTITFDR